MSALSQIIPKNPLRAIDLVRSAGVNVTAWGNFKGGERKAATNPNYCYEWSFVEPTKVVVLNLWYSELKERNDEITYQVNWREVARRFGELLHNGVSKRRSLKVDRAVQFAARKNLPVRVIVCEGEMRDMNEPKAKASRVYKRLLDPVPWAVTAYDWRTGACTVTRGATPNRYLQSGSSIPRFFTHYWLNETWERNRAAGTEGKLLNHSGSNLFLRTWCWTGGYRLRRVHH
jgi:hypothetical protein